jgi:hypothetical protein
MGVDSQYDKVSVDIQSTIKVSVVDLQREKSIDGRLTTGKSSTYRLVR